MADARQVADVDVGQLHVAQLEVSFALPSAGGGGTGRDGGERFLVARIIRTTTRIFLAVVELQRRRHGKRHRTRRERNRRLRDGAAPASEPTRGRARRPEFGDGSRPSPALTCFLVSLLRVGSVPLQVRRRPWGGPPGFCSLLRSGWNKPTRFVHPTLYLRGGKGVREGGPDPIAGGVDFGGVTSWRKPWSRSAWSA